jgi:hypothetical protein
MELNLRAHQANGPRPRCRRHLLARLWGGCRMSERTWSPQAKQRHCASAPTPRSKPLPRQFTLPDVRTDDEVRRLAEAQPLAQDLAFAPPDSPASPSPGIGALQLEILALRHQLGVMQRSVRKPRLNGFDRFLWPWLCGAWAEWRSALYIVEPGTVIAWHRKGFRLFWTWKVRRGQRGRPAVSKEVRKLIRKMSRENPLWGAPRELTENVQLSHCISQS